MYDNNNKSNQQIETKKKKKYIKSQWKSGQQEWKRFERIEFKTSRFFPLIDRER